MAKNNKRRLFHVLYDDNPWVFDQSERARGPLYVIMPVNVVYRINCAAIVKWQVKFDVIDEEEVEVGKENLVTENLAHC